MTLTAKQRKDVARAFALSDGEEDFDRRIGYLSLDGSEYSDEIARIIYAIATTQINIKLP